MYLCFFINIIKISCVFLNALMFSGSTGETWAVIYIWKPFNQPAWNLGKLAQCKQLLIASQYSIFIWIYVFMQSVLDKLKLTLDFSDVSVINLCWIFCFNLHFKLFKMQLLLLDVSHNKLKALPDSIGSCFSLEELQANGILYISLCFIPLSQSYY